MQISDQIDQINNCYDRIDDTLSSLRKICDRISSICTAIGFGEDATKCSDKIETSLNHLTDSIDSFDDLTKDLCKFCENLIDYIDTHVPEDIKRDNDVKKVFWRKV